MTARETDKTRAARALAARRYTGATRYNDAMYRTSEGSRVLTGAERRLFADSLWSLVEEVELCSGHDDLDTGVEAFDRLTPGQQVWLLDAVGRALLIEEVPEPQLTQPIEAAVAAVFGNLEVSVEVEFDSDPSSTALREMILSYFLESKTPAQNAEMSLPPSDCEDLDEWLFLIELLRDRILFDEDWADEQFYVDSSPEAAGMLRRMMGINEEYFSFVPPDVGDREAVDLARGLRELCRSIVPG